MSDAKGPADLWVEADGDRDRYIALLREHGHLRDGVPCPICEGTDRHRHDPYDERVIPVDIFGHDIR